MFGMEAAFFLRELWQIKTALSYIQPGEQIIPTNMHMFTFMKVEVLRLIAVFLLFVDGKRE
jgi:peptidoglycan/LPS O-acetylase OafA/YrhL